MDSLGSVRNRWVVPSTLEGDIKSGPLENNDFPNNSPQIDLPYSVREHVPNSFPRGLIIFLGKIERNFNEQSSFMVT